MNLYVEAALGFGETRKRWMGGEQRVSVGRSEWADLTIWEDDTMADVHFEIVGDGREFLIRDLTGAKALTVNGAPVSVSRIGHRDIVCAGTTRFRLNVDRNESGNAVIQAVYENLYPTEIVQTHGPNPSDSPHHLSGVGFQFVVDSTFASITGDTDR